MSRAWRQAASTLLIAIAPVALLEVGLRLAGWPTERVRSLESAGVIKGYATDLDAAQLGLGLTVFIEVAIDRTSQDAFDAFRDAVLAIPQVQECHMVAGGFDYLLKVRVQDMAAYRTFLSDALASVPGVRSTHTYPVMESVKDGRAIDLSHLRS